MNTYNALAEFLTGVFFGLVLIGLQLTERLFRVLGWLPRHWDDDELDNCWQDDTNH